MTERLEQLGMWDRSWSIEFVITRMMRKAEDGTLSLRVPITITIPLGYKPEDWDFSDADVEQAYKIAQRLVGHAFELDRKTNFPRFTIYDETGCIAGSG